MNNTKIKLLTEHRNPWYFVLLINVYIVLLSYAVIQLLELQHIPVFISLISVATCCVLMKLKSEKIAKWLLSICLFALLVSVKSFSVIYNDFAQYIGVTRGYYLRQIETTASALGAAILIAVIIGLGAYKTVGKMLVAPYCLLILLLFSWQVFMEDTLPYALNSSLSILLLFILLIAKVPNRRKIIIQSSGLIILSIILLIGSSFLPQKNNLLHKKSVTALEKILYDDQGIDWKTNGDMQAVSTGKTTDKTAMTVIMEKPEALYLKGFIGSVYDDNHWTTLSNKKNYDAQTLFANLAKENVNSETMLAENYEQWSKEKPRTVRIYPKAAYKKFSYTPYELATSIQENGYKTDGMQTNNTWNSTSNYQYKIMTQARTMYPVIAQKKKDAAFLRVEGHYNEFVYKNYLKVSEVEHQLLQSYLEKDSGKIRSYDEAIKRVQEFLRQNLRFDDQTKTIKTDENFVQHTLENTKRGFDPHYATIATLLFREFGVPSRYVEGYILSKSQVKGKKNLSEMAVNAKDAHAWTEIYIDQLGWVPVEVTPGYDKKMPKLETPKGAVESTIGQSAATAKNIQTPGEQAGKKQVIKDLDMTNEPTPKKEQNKVALWVKIVASVLGSIFLLLITLTVYLFYKRRHIRKLKTAVNSADLTIHSKAIIAMLEWHFNYVLKLEKPNHSLFSWLEVLPNYAKKPMEEIINEYQKISYGQLENTERLEAYYQKLQQAIQRPITKWAKIKYYFKGVM